MRLWTKQARKTVKFTKSTPFSARCMVYYYIRKICDQVPCDIIKLSYEQLTPDPKSCNVCVKSHRMLSHA